jgi:hypothetical protein
MHDAEEVKEAAWEAARRHRSWGTSEAAEASANANMLAAACLSGGMNFPEEASAPATIYISNALAALADVEAARGAPEEALDLLTSALLLAKRYNALIDPGPGFTKTIYSLAARASVHAGKVAAARQWRAEDLVRSFDRNITLPFESLMRGAGLSGPRAFAVVSMLREAIKRTESESDRPRLEKLLAEVAALAPSIRPKTTGARQSFDRQLDSEMERARSLLGEEAVVTFTWEKAQE